MLASSSRHLHSTAKATERASDPLLRIATRVFKAAAFGEIPPDPSTSSGYVRQGFRPLSRRNLPRKKFGNDRIEIEPRLRGRRSFSTQSRSLAIGTTTTGAQLISFDLRSVQSPAPSDSVSLDTTALSEFVGVDETAGDSLSLAGGDPVDWGTGEFGPVTRYGEVTPGCWIEFRRMTTEFNGIYLGPSSVANFALVLLRSGLVEVVNVSDFTFVIPGFITPEEAAVICAAEEMSDYHLAAVQLLRAFIVQVEEKSSELVGAGARELYGNLVKNTKHLPGTRQFFINPSSALMKIGISSHRVERNQAVLQTVAMHRILMDDPVHFVADSISHRTTGRFSIRHPIIVDEFNTVRDWVRKGMDSPEMKNFAEKAATARAWGKQHPPKSIAKDGELETYPAEDVGIAWTESDQKILRFLDESFSQDRLIQSQPFMTLAPSIIKFVDLISTQMGETVKVHTLVDRERMMAFFGEIGVSAEWENWGVRAPGAGLMNWNSSNSRPRPKPKTISSSTTAIAPPTADEFYPSDPHASVRKDFNSLPVYTIDDPTASELDDGISIESAAPLPNGEQTYWVHVHIADPTALLHPKHTISLAAKARDASEYFPEKIWPMLPKWFIRGKAMSLGSKMDGNPEEQTLTMSSRVSESGTVLEIDIKAGIIRNVKRLTYRAVDQLLGQSILEPTVTLVEPFYPNGSEGSFSVDISTPPPRFRTTDDSTLSTDPVAAQDLKTLHTLAKAILQTRLRDEALIWNFSTASVSVSPSIDYQPLKQETPKFYSTAPLVSLTLPRVGAVLNSPAQLVVSEFMILANRAAARYCVEKGIPVPFRGQPKPAGTEIALDEALALRNPITGEIAPHDIVKSQLSFKGATESVEPTIHFPMGIRDQFGYVKVTSPLRRYNDMLAHWQIKASLLPSGTVGSIAPFTKSAVMSSIVDSQLIQKSRGRAGKSADMFWSLYVINKKLENPGNDSIAEGILENLTGLAMRDPSFTLHDAVWTQKVHIVELGISAQLVTKDESIALRAGDFAGVRLRDIAFSSRSRASVVLR